MTFPHSSPFSLLSNRAGRVYRDEPFPHLIVRNALPSFLYDTLAAHRPSPEKIIGIRPLGQNTRYDLNADAMLAAGDEHPDVLAFVAHHTSECWWHELLEVFGPAIARLYPDLDLSAAQTGVRFAEKLDVDLDCQFGINTPVTELSRVRGPHVDNPIELIGGLFYMREPDDDSIGGELQLFRRTSRDLVFHDKAETDDRFVELVDTVPYEANTFVAFVNHVESLHGVTPRGITPHCRLLVNLVAELRRPLFTLPR